MPADGGAPLSVFESGAILLYLAEKSGKLLSGELRERYVTLQWLFWQVGGLGRCWGKINIFPTPRRKPCPTLLNVFRWKPNDCMGC
ncbi:glutathione S-transferase [Klebsiella pneumoniae]|nr:glutathione S-transferase [Klebsiella pneumoniae]